MSFPRYPSYRASGAEWLGDVPAHWAVRPLKHVATLASGGTPDKARSDYWNGNVPWASSKDLKVSRLADTEDHITQLAIDEGAANLIPAGRILVVVRGMILAHSFPVATTLTPMAINQDFKAVRPGDGIDVSYLAWLLRGAAGETATRVEEAAHGTKVLRLDRWTSMALPVPPVEEQRALSAFLDRETAMIDALVADQERLIELLKEKRQAVVSHAVTEGLNPDAPMKPSAIEWLGAMPAHWTLGRIRSVSSFVTSGPRGWSERISDGGALFIQSGDLNDDLEVNFTAAKRVAVEIGAETARTQLHRGDVLVCITGAKTGNVAVCHSDSEAAYVNQHLCLVRPSRRVLPRFLGMTLKSQVGQTHFELDQYGLKQGLSLENVKDCPVPLPPLPEQEAVVRHIDAQAQITGVLLKSAGRAIALLQQRRTGVVSAAVTGQIDVRGIEHPASE